MSLRQSSNYLGPAQLWTLAAGPFVLGIDGFVLAGLLPQLANELGVSIAQAGQLTTLFALVYAVASPMIAILTGRWERRRLLVLGMAIFAAGMLFQAAGSSFVMVAVGRIVAALGAATFQANAYAVAGVLASETTRPRNLAAVALGTSLSLVAGLPFGVAIGSWLGWRASIWLLLVLALLVGALLGSLPKVKIAAIGFRTRLAALRQSAVLRLLISTLLALTPAYLILSYLPSIVPDSGGMIIIAMLCFGAGQVIGTRLVVPLITRFGDWPTFLGGAIATPLVLILLSVTQQSSVLASLSLLLLGGCVGVLIVPQQQRLFSLIPDLAPIALGFNGSASYIGSAVGAGLGGLVLAGSPTGWLAPAAAITAVVTLGLVFALAPERTTAKHPQEHSGRTEDPS
ncbi:MFS transporter [Psychromicrobium lacuslunae]|uniref:MFS transporter n=1 Tax=Psychromicrobium lacuslunae TaxID=1618207 RepID=UPI0005D326E3|nr:MFS transporter [Psychromicrobium lacuslunae]